MKKTNITSKNAQEVGVSLPPEPMPYLTPMTPRMISVIPLGLGIMMQS